MPRQVDQLPADATSLARRVRALERDLAELRASRRAAHTTLSSGVFQVLRPGAQRPAAVMAADLGDGQAGFQTNDADGTTWARLESGALLFGAEGIDPVLPTGVEGTADGGTLHLQSGVIEGGSQARIILASGDSPLAPGDGSPMISLGWDGSGSADMVVDVSGILLPRSMAWGTVTITPTAANTPTASVIGGLNVRGTRFFAFATPVSGVPGTQVTGVGVSNVSGSGLTAWLTRTTTTATSVNWLVIGI
ncbi:hypothetical protein ACH4ND_01570 [Streptomyces sp. NPDC017179]|uniref:hypothetical protein n=1 Tax=Streptomyces sp. NPDC017179 TaxID=3364979 RepID=UPI003797FAB1